MLQRRNAETTGDEEDEEEEDYPAAAMPEASTSGSAIPPDDPDHSTFENKSGLAEDMKFLARMPELCDVTFLVGDTREPVCAVKAVLAARSKCVYIYICRGVAINLLGAARGLG